MNRTTNKELLPADAGEKRRKKIMKNVFDYNFTTERHDGDVFYGRRISAELEKKNNETFGEYYDMEEKSDPSAIIKILEIVCMCIAIAGIGGIVNVVFTGEITLMQALRNAPVFFVLVLLSVVGFVAIRKYSKRLLDEFIEEAEEQGIVDEMNDLAKLAEQELGLPEERFEIEAFCHHYEMDGEKKKLLTKGFWNANVMDVYERDACLCFFDGTQETAVPFELIMAVEEEACKMQVLEWLKEVDYKDRQFKKYKIRETNVGLMVTGCYRIAIEQDGGQYEIIVPNYEEEAMRKIVELIKPHKQM